MRPHPMVVKLGGALLDDPAALDATLTAISALHRERPGSVIVAHGGGSSVDRHLAALGMHSEKRDGIRITPPDHMAEISAVLTGKVNAALVAQLHARGVNAVGLSLADGLTTAAAATTRYPFDAGRVGEIVGGDPALLRTLLSGGFLPVLSSIAADQSGGLLNVNADDAAAAITHLVGASQLIFLTDVRGVLDRDGAVIGQLNHESAEELIARGVIRTGMIPKVRNALATAQTMGIAVRIASWNEPNVLTRIANGESVGSTLCPPNSAPHAAPHAATVLALHEP